MAADCKSVSVNSRWFESNLFHPATPILSFIVFSRKIYSYILRSKYKKYFNRIFLKHFLRKRRRRFFFLRNKFKYEKNYSCSSRFLYPAIHWKISKGFYPTIPYNAYQNPFKWIKKKFTNKKYHRIIIFFKECNEFIRKWRRGAFLKTRRYRYKFIHNFLYLYSFFFISTSMDLFHIRKIIKTKKQRALHYLILNFINNKLIINLQNKKRRNYFFLTSGLFIKFFERKKSFKKNKTIKFLMAKYLRKLFIVSRINSLILIIKKNPINFLEILKFINTPVIHKFPDPVEEEIIEETSTKFLWIKFLYFAFLDTKDFSKNKQKKRGRIKRKILRKLVFENKLVD